LEFSGLRPGEKLFEELLISASDFATDHPLILQAKEGFLPANELQPLLASLLEAASHQQPSLALQMLRRIVPEYNLQQPLLFQQDGESLKPDDSSVA
jgi:FlaA1/EpsC-like NDP-sugar epimerase